MGLLASDRYQRICGRPTVKLRSGRNHGGRICPTFQDALKDIQTVSGLLHKTTGTHKTNRTNHESPAFSFTPLISINPNSILKLEDKTGFSGSDPQDIKEIEVDFIINSPGGFAQVTEVTVSMLRVAKFTNIRFAIPNMAIICRHAFGSFRRQTANGP